MATLVQSTPVRHPLPQPYPIVRPSSSSAIPQSHHLHHHHSQRVQPLYLVSAQQQMYMQQQQQMQANYDFTRQSFQAQQQSKQTQRRQPQPNSAPPHPQQTHKLQKRSRSDEALRDKAQHSLMNGPPSPYSNTPSMIPGSGPLSSQPQAQSAPRPQSAHLPAFRPGTSLTPPPSVLGSQQRPSSADGARPTSSLSSYRGRVYTDQVRYSPGSLIQRDSQRDGTPRDLQRPPSIQGHPARYSAEDVSTLKNLQHQQYPHGYTQNQHPLPNQQFQSPRATSLKHNQQSLKPQSPKTPQGHIPAIQRRQSSLVSQRPPSRVLSPPPTIKRSSSSPELAPPQSPIHRKSSSSSSNISSASAPSQLESSSHSTIPERIPFVPSPLGKAPSPDPPTVESTQILETPVKKSFSARLRRALSFSSSSKLATSTSTPDLHAASIAMETVDITDTISISSTASSASVMLRKMSSGLKKSRKSIIGIFKGGRKREDEENKFPFGTEEDTIASVAVSHVTVEGDFTRGSDDRRKSMVFVDREGKKEKPKMENVGLKGILKHSDSRQSSFESMPSSTDSIKSAILNEPIPLSDFAVSLASTLDSQFNYIQTPPPEQSTDLQNPPSPEKSTYFDLPPSAPFSPRQVVTAPATPTGRTTPRRGIQFSPRLEVHETWPSAEYDRRGEPATCNRLTAQLAQMIKEELNAFKMEEMIVHEVAPFL